MVRIVNQLKPGDYIIPYVPLGVWYVLDRRPLDKFTGMCRHYELTLQIGSRIVRLTIPENIPFTRL